MRPTYLETLSPELVTLILGHLTTKHDLNSLSRTSRAFYGLTTPKLYNSWSYHGLVKEPTYLKKFLETVHWRPDLASHVQELNIRQWGICRQAEDFDAYDEYLKEKEKIEQESHVGRTMLDDGLFGESDEEWDEGYEDGNGEERDESNDDVDDRCEVDLEEDELEALNPLIPFAHEECPHFESGCNHTKEYLARQAGVAYDREDTIVQYTSIITTPSSEKFTGANDDRLISLLLSKLPNIKTLYIVLPELDEWDQKDSALCNLLTNPNPTSPILQKLETLYICSALHRSPNNHREYELDYRRIIPFLSLPSMRNLHILTPFMYWDTPNLSPLNFHPLTQKSNITHLTYDESVLAPADVTSSLSIFKSLTSFRWTTTRTCYSSGRRFVTFQQDFGDALRDHHRHSLEELWFDSRHEDLDIHNKPIDIAHQDRRKTLIGTLKSFKKLRKLAIDVNSLCGYQKYVVAPGRKFQDILPPSLVELTLFVKISPILPENIIDPGLHPTEFDNELWYPSFLSFLRDARTSTPSLKKIHIQVLLDRGNPNRKPYKNPWWQRPDLSIFDEAKRLCESLGIGIEVVVASAVYMESQKRCAGHALSEIEFFREQIGERRLGTNP